MAKRKHGYEFERQEDAWFSEHKDKWTRTSPRYDLVGTAEVAAILGVERPRIGRWIKKGGVLPQPVARVGATPLWYKADIEEMRADVESRRRQPVGV